MAAVRSRNTLPEMIVRRALHAAGLRYRLHVKLLPGSPDLVLKRHRMAVFVHGCFWHGHHCARGKLPSTNREFWQSKIEINRRRDDRNHRNLAAMGWEPVVLWQCEIGGTVPRLIERLKGAVPQSARVVVRTPKASSMKLRNAVAPPGSPGRSAIAPIAGTTSVEARHLRFSEPG